MPLVASKAPATPTADLRQTVELTTGWRFRLGNPGTGAQEVGYPDASWTRVSLPHTWNRVGYYKPDPSAHRNRADNVNKTQGVGWYRLSFDAPSFSGKKAWLEFDAASRTAEIWLNGQRIGEHRGGFSRFRFDVTGTLRPGKLNLLAVRVDNSQPSEGSPTSDVLPYTGDFFVHGGLYRPARLILTDPVHIDMMDLGGPGVYARTRSIAPGEARVDVISKLRNDSPGDQKATLAIALLDASGRIAARSLVPVDLAAGSGSIATTTLTVPHPRLWQGTADPYLYTLRAELRRKDGRALDLLQQPFGIRIIRLDPERGFFLNGKPLRLHGVGLHQDFEGKGWAQSPQDVATSFSIIREMGANAIRLTHYEHGQPIHELADHYGLILWDEIPLVTAWTLRKSQTQPTPALVANARQQLQELIRQNYNHPSVAVWSIANEVDFGPHQPGALREPGSAVADPVPLLRQLNALAKREDSSRPTVLANCCEERGSGIPPVEDVVDANGANRYFGWYYGKPEELDAHLDLLRAKRPWQPLAVTEYGAGAATTVHSDNPLGGPANAGGSQQPEEYQSWVHEQTWPIINSKPYLWASWLWNAFDFASTVRHEGDSEDLNTKGLVTYDRRTRKDAFYFYKANWTSTPTVHINGRRYVDRAYPVTDVRVYSNAPSTLLKLNGVRLAARSHCPQDVCVWQNVRLREGTNLLIAEAAFRKEIVEDEVRWRLAPDSARSFRIDSGALVAAHSTSAHFGSDAFFEGGHAGSAYRKDAILSASPDRDLLSSYREGKFHYRIPVENGRYRITLGFIEPRPRTRREFNVLANGVPVLSRFNILATAGAPMTAVERSFAVSINTGMLDLDFEPLEGEALVSEVQVVPE